MPRLKPCCSFIFATVNTDLQVLLWDKLSQTKLKSLERHKNSIKAVCIRYPLGISGSRNRVVNRIFENKTIYILMIYNRLGCNSSHFVELLVIEVDNLKVSIAIAKTKQNSFYQRYAYSFHRRVFRDFV